HVRQPSADEGPHPPAGVAAAPALVGPRPGVIEKTLAGTAALWKNSGIRHRSAAEISMRDRPNYPAVVLLGPLLVLCTTVGRAAESPSAPDFEKTYAPIVVKNCVGCHNASEPRGHLDLTRREGLSNRGERRDVIIPGEPEESYLIERAANGSMPP